MTDAKLPASAGANRKGAALMVGSMTAFTVNDAFMKALGAEWSVSQALFVRGACVVVLMLGFAAALGHLRRGISARDWRLMGFRTLCESVAALLFIGAIFNMPLAEATAILQTLPLTIALAGALILGEKVGWRRWLAILVGFVGVLFIVQPGGDGFSVYSLYAVTAVVLITFRDMASRQMSDRVPSLLVALVGAVGVTIVGAMGLPATTWAPFTPAALFGLGGAVLTVAVAYVFSVAAMRFGDIGFVAPYRYTSLLVSLILGIAIFNEVPGPLTILGALLITATGLYTLFRENRVRPRA
ncbi:MAG: DMT family transporter [Pseudomonadota bacterium]